MEEPSARMAGKINDVLHCPQVAGVNGPRSGEVRHVRSCVDDGVHVHTRVQLCFVQPKVGAFHVPDDNVHPICKCVCHLIAEACSKYLPQTFLGLVLGPAPNQAPQFCILRHLLNHEVAAQEAGSSGYEYSLWVGLPE